MTIERLEGPTNVTYVVRHRVVDDRRLEGYLPWLDRHVERIRREVVELRAIRRYRHEKDRLFRYVFYDFDPAVAWTAELQRATGRIRDAWLEVGADLREYTAVPYQEIWRIANGRSDLARHPLTIERLALSPLYPEKETEWNRWSEDDILPEQLGRLPLASNRRYRALAGDPRYYLQAHEYVDEPTMRASLAATANTDGSAGTAASKFWAGWAAFMPYVDDLTRWILLPDGSA